MTPEEKIKAYDEALKKVKDLISRCKNNIDRKTMIYRVEDIESIFPELAESEDERIRKAIIEHFSRGKEVEFPELEEKYNTWIAWLEKQESEPNWYHHRVDLSNCSEEYRKAYYDGWNNCNMQYSQCRSELNDVIKCLINGMRFYYEDNKDATFGTDKWYMPVKHIIDVLEKQGEQKSFDDLVKEITKNKETATSFLKSCSIMNANGELADEYKIEQNEQKPVWGKEDEVKDNWEYIQDFIENLGHFPKDSDELDILINYVLSKTKWSEEDSSYYDDICEILINFLHSEKANVNKEAIQKDLDWITSVKKRMEMKQE